MMRPTLSHFNIVFVPLFIHRDLVHLSGLLPKTLARVTAFILNSLIYCTLPKTQAGVNIYYVSALPLPPNSIQFNSIQNFW